MWHRGWRSWTTEILTRIWQTWAAQTRSETWTNFRSWGRSSSSSRTSAACRSQSISTQSLMATGEGWSVGRSRALPSISAPCEPQRSRTRSTSLLTLHHVQGSISTSIFKDFLPTDWSVGFVDADRHMVQMFQTICCSQVTSVWTDDKATLLPSVSSVWHKHVVVIQQFGSVIMTGPGLHAMWISPFEAQYNSDSAIVYHSV